MRKIVKNIVTLALIATVGVSGAIVASAKTNAYMTVTANMTTPKIAVAMVKNNTGTKRYSIIQIGQDSNMTTVYAQNQASLNGGEWINVSLQTTRKGLYAKGTVYKEWNPKSGVDKTMTIRIE